MAINKDFFVARTPVEWNGKVVCDVRGLTPNDITQAMVENASDMEVLMETFEKDSILGKVDVRNDAELSAALADNTTRMFTTLMSSVPDLAAKLIALASDDADSWKFVRDNFVMPLQFNILTEVAKLTFVDTNGFKAFLGNVMALIGNVTGQRAMTTETSPSTTGTAG